MSSCSERSAPIPTPTIFIAGNARWSTFLQQLLAALSAVGADARCYEWTSVDEQPDPDIEEALFQRPITLLALSESELESGACPRILRSAKWLTIYNPARLVLPLPMEPISPEMWQQAMGGASPFASYPRPGTFRDVIERILVLTALRPLPAIHSSTAQEKRYIGQALLSQQRYAEALPWLLPLLELPDPPRGVRAALAYGYAKLEHWQECVTLSQTALDVYDGLTAPFYCLGLGLSGLGDYDHAAMAFRRALSTNSNLAGAWIGLGKCLLQEGRTQEALLAGERGLATGPSPLWNAWAYEAPIVQREAHQLIDQAQKMLTESDAESN